MGRTQSQTDRRNLYAGVPAKVMSVQLGCQHGEWHSSNGRGSWSAIALIALLSAAIIARAALALYSTYILHSTYVIRWQTMC
jgi:hypothetical protein